MDSPDVIHGRMKEGAHIAGYSLQRAMENLRWLLEDSRFEQLGTGHKNVNDFLRDTQDAFALLNIKPEERKQIAELVRELQPKASQRAIGDLLGVEHTTIGEDLGTIDKDRGVKTPQETSVFDASFDAPAIPPDDYDPIKPERRKQEKEKKQQEREEERNEIIQSASELEPDERWNVSVGDINSWQTDSKYDFIITDPPYPKDYLPLYDVLAQRAREWLKPNGLLIAMCGQSYLDQIYQAMSKHLNYYWTSAYLLPGQPTPLRHRQVNALWKPILIYFPGDNYKGKIFGDVYKSDGNDKSFHKWGQSVSGMYSLISQICLPGQSIFDPFCGAGTTGVAALKHGCLFDGVDLDEDNINISKGRLSNYDSET